MVFTADDVRDTRVVIVGDDGQMVERAAGIPRDDKILELGGIEGYFAADEIGKGNFYIGVLKAHDISPPFSLYSASYAAPLSMSWWR